MRVKFVRKWCLSSGASWPFFFSSHWHSFPHAAPRDTSAPTSRRTRSKSRSFLVLHQTSLEGLELGTVPFLPCFGKSIHLFVGNSSEELNGVQESGPRAVFS